MILAAAFIEGKSTPSAPAAVPTRGGARPGSGAELGGSAHHFAGGADHPLRFELGNRLLVLLPAPVDVASLVDGGRRPEELVQTIVEQRVLGAVLLGDRTMRGRAAAPIAGAAYPGGSACWRA